jgi:putative membrane protein
MKIILPVMIGVVVGIVAFAHVLAWIFKHYHDMTISLLTGFIVGSLPIIWPWKIYENGALPMAKDNILPEMNAEFFIAVAIIILGAALIIATETIANRMKSKKENNM